MAENAQPVDPDGLVSRSTPLAFEGFVIHIGDVGRDLERSKAFLHDLLAQVLPGEWVVQPLGEGSLDYLIAPVSKAFGLTPAEAWDITMKFRMNRAVMDAEPAFVMPGIAVDEDQTSIAPVPGDCEWSLRMCNVFGAWEFSRTNGAHTQGQDITIGHPDTGYTHHYEINDSNRVLAREGYDFLRKQQDSLDDLSGRDPGHGTSTASVIISDIRTRDTTATKYVTGIAPRAKLLPLRVDNTVIHISWTRLCEALYYAVGKCHIISMSLGGGWGSSALHRAISHCIQNNIILLAAAGNEVGAVVYPARYDEVIAVTACNVHGDIWANACTGSSVDVTAPGESVWRARVDAGSQYSVDASSGTSYSVAIAAGVAALWLAHHGRENLLRRFNPGKLGPLFKDVLISGGVSIPPGKVWEREEWGAGIIDAEKLVRAQLPQYPPVSLMHLIRPTVGARAKNDFDRILEFFPLENPARIREVILEEFHVQERELEVLLTEIGDEFRFHLSMNPALRTSIAAKASSSMAGTRNIAVVTPDNWLSNCSMHFQKRVRERR